MARPYRVEIAQFYVTNACNLTCRDCISFNNLQFRGHLSWSDTEARAHQWSTLLDIDYLCVIGGEPMANPELDTWIRELRRLWPFTRREFSLITNGTYLSQWDPQQISQWLDLGVTIEVSVHDPRQWSTALAWAESQQQHWNRVNLVYDQGVLTHEYLRDQHRSITVGQHWLFGPSAIRGLSPQGLTFWDSDPETAHSQCPGRLCHYFVDGVMYKCPVTAVGSMLAQQLAVRDDQRQLLMSSQGCDPLIENDLDQWFGNLATSVPQCRLCPETWDITDRQPIWPLESKKPKVARISLDSLTTAGAHPATLAADAVPLGSSNQA